MRYCLLFLCITFAALSAQAQSISEDAALIEEGLLAMEDENYRAATRIFKELLASDSLHANAHFYLAQTYHKRRMRLLAARHARLAVRHDKKNVDHLILRHQIGFVNPVPIARARKRAFLGRILDVAPDNPYAHTEIAREHAQIYLNHKGRVRITDFAPASNNIPVTDSPQRGIVLPDQEPVRVQNPFDLDVLQAQGYNTMYVGRKADSSYEKAVSRLTQVLDATPTYVAAYEVLMALYVMKEEHEEMGIQAESMVRALPEHPLSSLFAGYAMYKLGRLGESEAHYQRALELMSEEDLQVYTDVARVLNKDQARRVPADSSTVAEYLKAQDPFLLSEENERILEHYSRLVFADLIFSEPKLDLRGWDSERGDIYVRYGHPKSLYFMTHNIESCGRNGMANIVNFQVFDYGAYHFVFGNHNSSLGITGQSVIGIPTLNEYVLYSPCAQLFANRGLDSGNLDYVLKAKSQIRDMPDDFKLGGNTVNFPHLAAQFRGEGGKTDLLVSYGFPVANELNEERPTASIGIESGAFLLHNTGHPIVSKKSIYRVYSDELLNFDGAVLWPGTHILEADPGSYTLSVEFDRASDSARGADQSEWVLDDYSGAQFSMSDILLAYSIEEHDGADLPDGYFSRNGLEIQAAPWGVYENDASVYFYFELYNIGQTGSALFEYDVEAALIDQKNDKKGLKRLFRFARRNKGNAVAVRFSRTSSSTDANEYLILETETIAPGTYTLVVQVTDKQTGEAVERRRSIYVR